jgi:HAD superfamily hydrolase (TIGR01490 family)
MGETEVPTGRRAAAFFDLDKTTIATASLFAFSSTLREAGYINSRLIMEAIWGRFVFNYLGADHERMEDMRNNALRLCKGWDQRHISELVTDALEEVLEPIVYSEAVEEIAAHRAAGHMIFMVSASPQEIVLPLSRYLGADGAVATIAETDRAGKYTGQVEFYSYGPYKADAIEALALEHDLDLDESYAYTDSITDLPMLETIGHPIVVNPDKALHKIATDRGWEVRWFSNTVPLRARVVEHARTGAFVAGVGMLAGGASWYVRSRRPRRLRSTAAFSRRRF